MNKILLAVTIVLASAALSGCETVKSTIAGPFVGLQKDTDNLSAAVNKMKPKPKPAAPVSAKGDACCAMQSGMTCEATSGEHKSKISKWDAWFQENAW